MTAIAENVRGPYPDGREWRCPRCGTRYPEDFEPDTCPKDGAWLMRTMLSFTLPEPE